MLDQSWFIIVSLGDVKTYHAGDAILWMSMCPLSLIETTHMLAKQIIVVNTSQWLYSFYKCIIITSILSYKNLWGTNEAPQTQTTW